MFKIILLQLLALMPLCDIKNIIVEFVAGLAADTATPVDDLAVLAVDVVLSNVLGCESPVNSMNPEAKSAVMESIHNSISAVNKTK